MEYPRDLTSLSSFRKFIVRIETTWPSFLQQRSQRLVQAERNGAAPEKVAEDILSDFFTQALDWSISDLNNQLQYADLVLTTLGIKRLLVEVKRPGSLAWDRWRLDEALEQARRYADEQRVGAIAISDGCLFYAADIVNGGLRDRVRLELNCPTCSPNSWWVSIDGIYRPAQDLNGPEHNGAPVVPHEPAIDGSVCQTETPGDLFHPKYKIPAACFAYVGDATDTATWKLPYRLLNGSVDMKHLPGAIRAVASNYRGARVKTIPEKALPDVLVRLGKAAAEMGRLPGQTPNPQLSYQQLYDVLRQLGRLKEVLPDETTDTGV